MNLRFCKIKTTNPKNNVEFKTWRSECIALEKFKKISEYKKSLKIEKTLRELKRELDKPQDSLEYKILNWYLKLLSPDLHSDKYYNDILNEIEQMVKSSNNNKHVINVLVAAYECYYKNAHMKSSNKYEKDWKEICGLAIKECVDNNRKNKRYDYNKPVIRESLSYLQRNDYYKSFCNTKGMKILCYKLAEIARELFLFSGNRKGLEDTFRNSRQLQKIIKQKDATQFGFFKHIGKKNKKFASKLSKIKTKKEIPLSSFHQAVLDGNLAKVIHNGKLSIQKLNSFNNGYNLSENELFQIKRLYKNTDAILEQLDKTQKILALNLDNLCVRINLILTELRCFRHFADNNKNKNSPDKAIKLYTKLIQKADSTIEYLKKWLVHNGNNKQRGATSFVRKCKRYLYEIAINACTYKSCCYRKKNKWPEAKNTCNDAENYLKNLKRISPYYDKRITKLSNRLDQERNRIKRPPRSQFKTYYHNKY
jgi:hypothetical protein